MDNAMGPKEDLAALEKERDAWRDFAQGLAIIMPRRGYVDAEKGCALIDLGLQGLKDLGIDHGTGFRR